MTYRKHMEFLGYVVTLQDGTTNPIALEADRILCERPGRPDSIMLGVAIAEAWRQAEQTAGRRHDFTLESHAGDPDAVRIVCDCGSSGALMSRSWNWDDKSQSWEPQPRHLPPCGHLRNGVSGVTCKN